MTDPITPTVPAPLSPAKGILAELEAKVEKLEGEAKEEIKALLAKLKAHV